MPQMDVEDPPQSSENFLKERFVERSLEKILRLLRTPPLNARDYVMMGFMALILLALILTRSGAASNTAELKDIAQKLDKITTRLDTMQGSAPPTRSTPAGTRTPASTASTSSSTDGPAARKAPGEGQPDVEHALAPGETLWSVAEQYYGDGSQMTALMNYNKIIDAKDLKSGVTIKVPSRKKLDAMPGAGPSSGPRPTPH